jgi:hypothetical protein
MVISVIWLRRKQSPKEVDSDERDKLIQSRAVLVAFVSVWILLFAVSIIPRLVLGEDGSIPVCRWRRYLYMRGMIYRITGGKYAGLFAVRTGFSYGIWGG